MSLTASAILLLASQGLSIEQIAAVAEANAQPHQKSGAAVRQARYRDREKAKNITRDVTRDAAGNITRDVTNHNAVTPLARVVDKPLTLVEDISLSETNVSSRAARARRMPEGWIFSHADRATIEAMGFSPGEIERELATIRDFEFGTPRSDWSAVVRNWFRTELKRRPKNGQPSPKFTAHQQNLERNFAGAQAAALRRAQQ